MRMILLVMFLLLAACDADTDGEVGPKVPPSQGPQTPTPLPPAPPMTDEFGQIEEKLNKIIEEIIASGEELTPEQIAKLERLMGDLVSKKEELTEDA